MHFSICGLCLEFEILLLSSCNKQFSCHFAVKLRGKGSGLTIFWVNKCFWFIKTRSLYGSDAFYGMKKKIVVRSYDVMIHSFVTANYIEYSHAPNIGAT